MHWIGAVMVPPSDTALPAQSPAPNQLSAPIHTGAAADALAQAGSPAESPEPPAGTPSAAAAEAPADGSAAPWEAPSPAPDQCGEPAAPPPELAPIDLSPERLEAQDALRWNGRMLSELSDVELAAAAEGLAAMDPPPEQPSMRNQRNWLKLRVTWPQKRVLLRLRVDEGVFEWFNRGGAGCPERINAVLRAYVEAQLEAEAHTR